jgi:hypothetical protein
MSPTLKRKVFFATALKQDDVVTEFAAILERYKQAVTPEDAEFVIFDLDHPPANWFDYIKSRSVAGEKIGREAFVPCLLSCKSQIAGDAVWIKKQIDTAFPTVRVAPTPGQLLADLQWLECMIPYTRRSPEEVEKGILLQVVALSRLEGAGK